MQIKITNEMGLDFIDMPDSADNPCFSCGACCGYFRVSFPYFETTANGGVVPEHKVIPITPVYVAMKGTENKQPCVNLTGKIGKMAKCGDYANRPSSCRTYEVWDENGNPSAQCNKAREYYGLPPLAPYTQ